jgi:hypothetical protein
MVTGRESFQWFIVGHMITAILIMRKILLQNVPMKEGEEVLHQ